MKTCVVRAGNWCNLLGDTRGFEVDANNQPELPNPFADIGGKSVQPKGSGAGRLCKGRV